MRESLSPMVPELQVTNFEHSHRFYTDVIGFRTRFRRSEPDFAYLELGDVHIMLEQVHGEAWITGDLDYPLGRGVNFQIEVPDLQKVYEALKRAQVPLFREIQETWYDVGDTLTGEREFLVQDPDGYLLRFAEHVGERSKV